APCVDRGGPDRSRGAICNRDAAGPRSRGPVRLRPAPEPQRGRELDRNARAPTPENPVSQESRETAASTPHTRGHLRCDRESRGKWGKRTASGQSTSQQITKSTNDCIISFGPHSHL